MDGGILHSEARKRLPRLTSRPLNATPSVVVGLKPAGMRLSAEPGDSFAVSRELERACARSSAMAAVDRFALLSDGVGLLGGLSVMDD